MGQPERRYGALGTCVAYLTNRVGLERKWRAAEMYRTQLEPHRSRQAMLPPFVLDRLCAVGEVVFT